MKKKIQARKNVIQAIKDIDWGKKSLSVRVNSINSSYFEGDLKSLMETNITRLDLLMLPKVESEKDVLKLEQRWLLFRINRLLRLMLAVHLIEMI